MSATKLAKGRERQPTKVNARRQLLLGEDKGGSNSQAELPHKGSVLGIYNYKGGVWKTSTAINLGAMLAGSQRKVLLVDADSQCNLTSFFFPTDEDDDGVPQDVPPLPSAMQDPDEPCIGRYSLNNNARPAAPEDLLHGFAEPNIRTLMNRYLEPDGAVPEAQQLAEAIWDIPDYKGNLMVLPGAYDLGRLESDCASISYTMGANGQPEYHVRTNRYAGSFRMILNKLIQYLKIDFVLIDFAPANSAVNKVFAMSCDFLLPPVFPDFFSMSSVEGLLREVLPSWYQWRQQVEDYQATPKGRESHTTYRLSELMSGPPKILPFIVQNIELYHPRDLVTKSKSSWIKSLIDLVAGPVPDVVRRQFRPNQGVMVIPFMLNLRSVFERSHEYAIPIVDLAPGMWGASPRDAESQWNLIRHARERYASLVQFLLFITAQ